MGTSAETVTASNADGEQGPEKTSPSATSARGAPPPPPRDAEHVMCLGDGSAATTAPPDKHDSGDDADRLELCNLTSEKTIQEVQAALSHSMELFADMDGAVVPVRVKAIRKSASATTARWAEGKSKDFSQLVVPIPSPGQPAGSRTAPFSAPTLSNLPPREPVWARSASSAPDPQNNRQAAGVGDAEKPKGGDELLKKVESTLLGPSGELGDAPPHGIHSGIIGSPCALRPSEPRPRHRPLTKRTTGSTSSGGPPMESWTLASKRFAYLAVFLAVPLLTLSTLLLRIHCDPTPIVDTDGPSEGPDDFLSDYSSIESSVY